MSPLPGAPELQRAITPIFSLLPGDPTMNKNKTLRHLLLATGLALASAAGIAFGQATAPSAAQWAAVGTAAAKEAKLTFYHNLNPGGMETVVKEFRTEVPGIDVQLVRLGSAPLIQRFSTEFAAGRNIADVVLTTVDQSIFDGAKAGWASAWVPPEIKNFQPAANYHNMNMLFNIQTVRDAIIWNTQKVKAADAPKEWTDLFNPRWKGKVGMNPPWRSVTQQAIIAYWEKLGLGDTAAKMKANEVRFFEGSGGVLQAVVRGDVLVAQMLDLPLDMAITDGAPIGFVYPKSGTTLSQIYTFVSAKAPNPNAAKVFTNWMLTAKGQLLLQKYGGLAATRPGTPPMAHLPATSSLSNVQDSLELTPPAKQKEIVDHWRKTFGIQ